jgi:hypothetical protein
MFQLTLCRFPILNIKLYVLHELILFKQGKPLSYKFARKKPYCFPIIWSKFQCCNNLWIYFIFISRFTLWENHTEICCAFHLRWPRLGIMLPFAREITRIRKTFKKYDLRIKLEICKISIVHKPGILRDG